MVMLAKMQSFIINDVGLFNKITIGAENHANVL